jgi:exodeoxyribonuclease-1
MHSTFLFYDIETTGLNKSFDQVLQFAAIRTDHELHELERHEFFIRLNPDVIPSPKAMITHHLSLHDIAKGHHEFEAMVKIHGLMNHPGTISVGYNTLGFDDEFLRFSFYRNLLPAYTHQFANGCGRMDIYPITVMYYLFKSHLLQWPANLKLENLNTLNQLSRGRAHHAMVDVEATLALAKIFFQDREMWDYVTGYFNKKKDEERVQPLKLALAIDGIFGAEQHYQSPVLFLGSHQHYKNQSIWLCLDQKDFKNLLPEKRYIVRKKMGEPSFIIPLTKKKFGEEKQKIIDDNLQWLRQNPDQLEAITHYHVNYQYPNYPNVDVEARLYVNGFLSPVEQNFCRQFHAANVNDKFSLMENLRQPSPLKTLAARILGRHFATSTDEFEQYMRDINPVNNEDALIDYRGQKRLTPKAALVEIKILKSDESLTEEQRGLLQELENDLCKKFAYK